jgi:predicted  nucleic acid-binding Zn-ribbon protein
MSFSDLMSSSRGPGVVGMILALVVMAIFVILFVFAFDDRFQGGQKSIQSVISDQAQEIDSFHSGIEDGKKTLVGIKVMTSKAEELAQLNRDAPRFAERLSSFERDAVTAKEELARSEQDFEAYKDRYRTYVRNKAKGEVWETLKTEDGKTYTNVKVREVTPVGIQVMHDDGHKRIPFELLPDSLQDYFQFDADQKAKVLASEDAALNEHEAAVASTKAQETSVKEVMPKVEKTAVARDIAIKQGQIASIRREISNLKVELSKAEARASEARFYGRSFKDSTGPISRDIASKESRISMLEAEILQLNLKQN